MAFTTMSMRCSSRTKTFLRRAAKVAHRKRHEGKAYPEEIPPLSLSAWLISVAVERATELLGYTAHSMPEQCELDAPPPMPAEARASPPASIRRRARRFLPPDFLLDDQRCAYATEKLGYSREQVVEVFDKFVAHHIAEASKFRDWDKAWRGWVSLERRLAASPRPRPSDTLDRIAQLQNRK